MTAGLTLDPREALRFRRAFRFPIATRDARRDLLVGGATLIIPPLGWILNMGHRLEVVRLLAGGAANPFPGFQPWSRTLARGVRALLAILTYMMPGTLLALVGLDAEWLPVTAAGAALLALGIFLLPGGMTYNGAFDDMAYLTRPWLAWRQVRSGGRRYLRAWGIAVAAIALSTLGLAAFVVGFAWSSVWAWQVVGYVFTSSLLGQETDG